MSDGDLKELVEYEYGLVTASAVQKSLFFGKF